MKMRMAFHQIENIGKKKDVIEKKQIEILGSESIGEMKNSLEQLNIRFLLEKESVILKTDQ